MRQRSHILRLQQPQQSCSGCAALLCCVVCDYQALIRSNLSPSLLEIADA